MRDPVGSVQVCRPATNGAASRASRSGTHVAAATTRRQAGSAPTSVTCRTRPRGPRSSRRVTAMVNPPAVAAKTTSAHVTNTHGRLVSVATTTSVATAVTAAAPKPMTTPLIARRCGLAMRNRMIGVTTTAAVHAAARTARLAVWAVASSVTAIATTTVAPSTMTESTR